MSDAPRSVIGLKVTQNEKEPVTNKEQSQLWESEVFVMEMAQLLLNVVYYYNVKKNIFRGGEHSRICLKNFETGNNYNCFQHNASKTFHGGSLDLKYKPSVVILWLNISCVLFNISTFIFTLCKFA